MTEFDKVKTYTGRTRTEQGWLGRDNIVGRIMVEVMWRCKQCKQYFTTEEAKAHKHDSKNL